MASPAQSKSSLSTLVDCEYKYGQVYLLGKRAEQSDPAIAGVKVHKLLEDWRNTGVIPSELHYWNEYAIGGIALEMIKLLPPFGTEGITTEQDVTFEIHGYKYRAIKDWVQEDPPTLGDYKTTSNIDGKHVLSTETFLSDIQAVLSARHMDSDVLLHWTYGQTKGPPRAKSVQLPVLRAEVDRSFKHFVEPMTVRALQIHSDNDPESLPKNLKACTKYGWANRCHLYDHCHPKQRSVSMGVSLLEQLRKSAVNPPVPETQVQDEVLINPPPMLPSPQLAPAFDKQLAPAFDNQLAPAFDNQLAPAQEDPPKKRGRPKKEPAPPPKPIRTLFVDCWPLSGQVQQAHVLIARAAEAVCADLQVPHIKLVDFGKGGGCLSAQLESDIKSMEPGFDLMLNSRTVEGREVYHTLLTLADNVVIGL